MGIPYARSPSVASADVPFIFEETTADFPAVTIQGRVSYRVGEPKRLAALLNYTLAPDGLAYAFEDPEKLPERVVQEKEALLKREALEANIGLEERARGSRQAA